MDVPTIAATIMPPFSLRFLLLFLALPVVAHAQTPATDLSDDARVSVLTVLPGDAIYSMFGHSAFRVTDPVQGIDWTYNYGTFDFGNPITFAFRFAYGALDYQLSVNDFGRAAAFYRYVERRPIIEQHLDLTPEQRRALFRYLQHNALPENRTYRYDFLFDNCSTRIRDVLDRALPGAVHYRGAPGAGETFRHLLDPYAVNHRFLDLGYDLLLGASVDRPATAGETVFLPVNLMGAFAQATVEHDGARLPLVSRTDTLFWIDGRYPARPSPPWASLFTWLLLLGGVGITAFAGRTHRIARVFDRLLFGTVGAIGLLIAFLWFFSLHHVTDANWNLLWAWPTHLAVAFFVGSARRQRLQRVYLLTAALSAFVTLAGWRLWPQELHPALLPILLLLALRAGARAYQLRRRP